MREWSSAGLGHAKARWLGHVTPGRKQEQGTNGLKDLRLGTGGGPGQAPHLLDTLGPLEDPMAPPGVPSAPGLCPGCGVRSESGARCSTSLPSLCDQRPRWPLLGSGLLSTSLPPDLGEPRQDACRPAAPWLGGLGRCSQNMARGHKPQGHNLGDGCTCRFPGPLPDPGVGLAGLAAWKSAHPPAPSGEPHRCYRPDALLAGLGQRGGRPEAGGGLLGPSGGPC